MGTSTERCLSPAEAGEQPRRQGQARPSWEGGSSPLFWAGCGCWHESSQCVGNQAHTHKLSPVSTSVTNPTSQPRPNRRLSGTFLCPAWHRAGALSPH